MCVVSCLRNVPDPLLGFVSALLLYPQVSHSQATTREHGYLELHCYRRFLPCFFWFSLCKVGNCSENLFLITLKLLDSPEYSWFVWLILTLTAACWEYFDLRCVWWHGYLYNNVICVVCTLKNWANFYWVLDPTIVWILLNYRRDFEWQIYILAHSIRHYFK